MTQTSAKTGKFGKLFSAKAIAGILLFIFLGSIVAYKIDLPDADDMARHVENGKMILQGKWDVLYQNFYSYTLPHQPFVNHHWLFGPISYALLKVSGWDGLVIFKTLVFLVAFGLLFAAAVKKSNFWLVAFFSIPTIFIISERTSVRPEMLSYLFLAAFLYILTDLEFHPDSKKIYWLIPIQILWVNIHLFFPVGVALFGGFVFEKMWVNRRNLRGNKFIKRLLVVLLLLVLACVVNPNLIRGALYPLNIFRNYGFDVSENHSPFYFFRTGPTFSDPALVTFIFSAALLLISFVPGFLKKQKPIYYFLGAVATIIGGLLIVRFLVLFAFIFLPAVTLNLNDWYEKIVSYLREKKSDLAGFLGHVVPAALVLALLFFIITNKPFHTEHGIGLTAHSNDPGQFLIDNSIQGPFFNDYDSGSYLIYNLFPKEKVFLDNRPEAYNVDFFQNTYEPMFNDESVWQQKDVQYNFNAIFLYRYDNGTGVQQFMYNRVKDPNWALVYADGEAVIYLKRNSANQEIINRFEITKDNVQQRMEYLRTSNSYEDKVAAADTYNLAGRPDLGMEQFFDVVTKWPHAGKIWMVMGEWELLNTDAKSPEVAVLDELNAINNGYGTAEAYADLGKAYAQLKKYAQAQKAYQAALRKDPTSQVAKDGLQNLQTQ